jgi:glyoxylase-like metal-dependent hydrolase (beta-lactamase superfamily II)
MKRLAAYVFTTCAVIGVLQQRQVSSQVNTVKELAPDVYFHEGELRGKGHCNNGWVIFDDFVLVLDANFPSGAREIIPKIQAQTKKPIRFAFDTHHHGDHAYANQVWADAGAVPVAHENVVSEMKKYDTGLFGGKPGRWEDEAKNREDLRTTKLKAPTLLYRDVMMFDDGKHRVELRYFGVGHTHGDGFAWLPKERILFTGDAAVNGPYNYMGDGDSAAWIETLAKAHALGATIVAPGHGPSGTGNVIEAQREYFIALRGEVAKRKDLTPDRMQAEVPAIRKALLTRHPTYIEASGKEIVGFESQVAQVYREMTNKEFPKKGALEAARVAHERHHGIENNP